MDFMRFSKLSLLSQKERRGLQIDFKGQRSVIVAGNGFGKSAVVKSLYECLGAKPQKVDREWAGVISLLEFTVGQIDYAAIKVGASYTIISGQEVLVSTNQIVSVLAPALARILDFGLVLADRKGEIRTPPPSFAFAPFYIDQDKSWQKTWEGFSDLQMFPKASKSLAEYYSGLRPNGYYNARADRDLKKAALVPVQAERKAVAQALQRVQENYSATPITMTLGEFKAETERLVTESQKLIDEQAKYRQTIALLNEEHRVWHNQVKIVEAAIVEVDATLHDSFAHDDHVECPMCGQDYANGIVEQFDLVADRTDLIPSLVQGRDQLQAVDQKLIGARSKVDGIEKALASIHETLSIQKNNITLQDVVAAQGKNEARRFLDQRLSELDSDIRLLEEEIAIFEKAMKSYDSKKRKAEIQDYYAACLSRYSKDLDVALPDKKVGLQGLEIGRGSVAPRALAMYYYSFLATAQAYGSSTFCPIVIDAPNQQGQDKVHLQTVMKFLLSNAPKGSQVIVAAEDFSDAASAQIIDVTWKKDQVLREDSYELVSEYVAPYLEIAIR